MQAPKSSARAGAEGQALEPDPPAAAGRPDAVAAPITLRLRVHLLRRVLDRRLAAGHACESTPALALRARQIADPHARQQLARSLRRVVDFVDGPGSRRARPAPASERAPVSRGRQAVHGLATRLEGEELVSPRGVVLARALLTNGFNPLSNPHCQQTVSQAVSEVEEALDVDRASIKPPEPGSYRTIAQRDGGGGAPIVADRAGAAVFRA